MAVDAIPAVGRTGRVSASDAIQVLASRQSSNIYLYDLAVQLGFGPVMKTLNRQQASSNAPVIEMETRDGAGLALLGWINGQSSNLESSVITAFTNPTGLAHMASSLSSLQKPFSSSNRLVIQVPNISVLPDSLAFSPSLGCLNAVLPLIPEHVAIVLSSTAQEAMDLAKVSYSVRDKHVVHIFDHYALARETQFRQLPVLKPSGSGQRSLEQNLASLGYDFFDYVGPKDASSIIVLLNGPIAGHFKALLLSSSKESTLGLLIVRVVKPWKAEALRAAVPNTAKNIYVIDDVLEETSGNGYLHGQVFSALFEPGAGGGPNIKSLKFSPAKLQELLSDPSKLTTLAQTFSSSSQPIFSPKSTNNNNSNSKKLLFYSAPSSNPDALPELVERTFAQSKTVKARLHTEYDLFSKPGGTALHRMLLAPKSKSSPTAAEEDSSILPLLVPHNPNMDDGTTTNQIDFISISDPTLLKTHSVLNAAKERGGCVLLLFTNWLPEEVSANLPVGVVRRLVEGGFRVYVIDSKAVAVAVEVGVGGGGKGGEEEERKTLIERACGYMAFMRLYLGEKASRGLVESLSEVVFGEDLEGDYGGISEGVWSGLREVILSSPMGVDSEDEEKVQEKGEEEMQLQTFEFNAISPPRAEEFKEVTPSASLETWMDAAKFLLFREAFSLPSSPMVPTPTPTALPTPGNLRPDIPTPHYLVTCSVNKRLTPLTYSRNVFHLEFDTRGTGLKYAIGEALGVHGWNDAGDVVGFCRWYGVDPGRVIRLPVPDSGGGAGKYHRRTIFQALQQQIDIFGQPPKSFYASLAPYATLREERMTLLFIASPEGASTFKKLSERDTVTYADVLERFGSARPGIEELVELVGDVEERHYSIASAQSVVGDRVDLLVVTVDWVTPGGSPRFGQCTRYLAGLKPGQKVTVSIKASVMKLPPDDMQPIIMAGLGTGAAPFRAFMQHRALLAAQNKPAGPLIYYFGSRHRSEEYLYGEEIEAYLASSVITHAGLAFSRDQKEKEYIQHKMAADGDALIRMLRREKGVFYLCGPTWPVPDVYETLVKSLVRLDGGDLESAAGYFEGLKEEERYVLEVY